MKITFLIIVLIFVGILFLINFDDSLKAKLNIIVMGLRFLSVISEPRRLMQKYQAFMVILG